MENFLYPASFAVMVCLFLSIIYALVLNYVAIIVIDSSQLAFIPDEQWRCCMSKRAALSLAVILRINYIYKGDGQLFAILSQDL